MVKGRWADSRLPTEQELKATTVLRLDIEEASAKIRTGGPKEEEADYALPIWGGHIPLALQHGKPVGDGHVLPGVEVPDYVKYYRRR